MGAEVFSGALDRASLHDVPRDPLDSSFFASLAGASPFDSSTFPSRGPTSAPRLFILTLLYSGAERGIFVLLLTLIFC